MMSEMPKEARLAAAGPTSAERKFGAGDLKEGFGMDP